MAKVKLKEKEETKRVVFKDELNSPNQKKVWVSSGSVMLNLMYSGKVDKAYVRGRIVNTVGDKSTGKTLLAEELINVVWYWLHIKLGKKVVIVYDEPEAAFDMEWAIRLGVPVDNIIWVCSSTVTEFEANVWRHIKKNPDAYLILYILDSLDALSDEAEQTKLIKKLDQMIKKQEKDEAKRTLIVDDDDPPDDSSDEKEEKIKGSFGGGKAKGMSEFFRTMAKKLNTTNCLLFIISQTRDKIGIVFGEKITWSGGKALGFYASQVSLLHEAEKYRSSKSKLVKGVKVVANCRKNKVAPAYRTVSFDILFAYGVDNYGSCIDFLHKHKVLKGESKVEWKGKKYYRDEFRRFLDDNPDDWDEILDMVQETWDEMEEEIKVDLKPKWEIEEDEED